MPFSVSEALAERVDCFTLELDCLAKLALH